MSQEITASAKSDYELRLDRQLGWAAGSLGTGIMLGALTGYGLYFMTDYLGISALEPA